MIQIATPSNVHLESVETTISILEIPMKWKFSIQLTREAKLKTTDHLFQSNSIKLKNFQKSKLIDSSKSDYHAPHEKCNKLSV